MITVGAKEQRIVSDGDQGIRLEDIEASNRNSASLSDAQIAELVSRAKAIEEIFETGPQDIEWGSLTGSSIYYSHGPSQTSRRHL